MLGGGLNICHACSSKVYVATMWETKKMQGSKENTCEVYNFWGGLGAFSPRKNAKFRGLRELFGCWYKPIACLSPLILLI